MCAHVPRPPLVEHLLQQAGIVSFLGACEQRPTLTANSSALIEPVPSSTKETDSTDESKLNQAIKPNYESFFRTNPSKSKFSRALSCWGFYFPTENLIQNHLKKKL